MFRIDLPLIRVNKPFNLIKCFLIHRLDNDWKYLRILHIKSIDNFFCFDNDFELRIQTFFGLKQIRGEFCGFSMFLYIYCRKLYIEYKWEEESQIDCIFVVNYNIFEFMITQSILYNWFLVLFLFCLLSWILILNLVSNQWMGYNSKAWD